MKISIVTTSYSSEKTIEDTIQSVLAQKYDDYEHIIIDGASKDSTMSIVKKYEPEYNGRLKYVSEPDKGIYNAMNKGLKMVAGDVAGTLNSDDIYADNEVLNAVANAFAAGNTDCVFGKLYIVNGKNTGIVERESNSGPYKEGAFFKGWHPAHPTFYAKTECYKKFGYFDESLKIAADIELMLRFFEINKISGTFIDKVLVRQREGGASTTISGHIKGNIEVLRAFKMNGLKAPLSYIPKKVLPKILDKAKIKLGLK